MRNHLKRRAVTIVIDGVGVGALPAAMLAEFFGLKLDGGESFLDSLEP